MPFSSKRLLHLRNERGWNNAELARRAGLTRPSVSRYVDGKVRNSDAKTCFALARALGVHPSELDPIYNDPILYRGRNNTGSLQHLPSWLADLCAHVHQIPPSTLLVLEAAAKAAVEKCPPNVDGLSAQPPQHRERKRMMSSPEPMSLNGKLVCITGKLEHFGTKKDAWAIIEAKGGQVAKEITTQCDYLVLGGKGSPKYIFGEKGQKQALAEKWIACGAKINIVTEDAFLDLLGQSDDIAPEDRLPVSSKAVDIQTPALSRYGHRTETLPLGERSTYTEWYAPPGDVPQLLKITVNATWLVEPQIGPYKEFMDAAAIKRLIHENGCYETRVRTFVYPSLWDWSVPGQTEETATATTRIFALAGDAAEKAALPGIAALIREQLRAMPYQMEVSFRILDASDYYARIWIEKLFTSCFGQATEGHALAAWSSQEHHALPTVRPRLRTRLKLAREGH